MSVNRRLSDQFQLRLPGGMRERLKAAAAENDRSMNSEIVARLEDSFTLATADQDDQRLLDIGTKIDDLFAEIAELRSGRLERAKKEDERGSE